MSSTGNPTSAPTTAASVISALNTVGGWVTLGTDIGEEGYVLIKALVLKIEQIKAPDGTVTYQVVFAADSAELVSIDGLADADLAAVNQWLVANGMNPLSVPPDVTEATPPATGTGS
jgi:hypothetical protein